MWHNLGWSIWGSFKILSVAFFLKKHIADSATVFIFYKEFIYWFIWMSFVYSGEKKYWSPADFVRLPTDKEMIGL